MTGPMQEPNTVGFLTASLSARAGGIATSMTATINALGRLGLDTCVFGLKDDGFGAESLPYLCARVRAVGSWPTPAFRLAPALDRALLENQIDILHLQGLWLYPSIAAIRWRQRTDRPVVISPHGMLDPWALKNSAWKKRVALTLFERQNLDGAACIHALNRSEMLACRELGLKNPVAIIPNGVDLPDGAFSPGSPDCLTDEERRILLFLGRIHPKKGLSETIAAWAKAQRQYPSLDRDWVLVLAGWGDGGHVEKLERQVVDLDLQESVRFVGPVFGLEKSRLLARADAFILASHSEGQPMAVLEAWAYGIPVLMSRACNLSEGFSAGAAIELPTEPAPMAPILANALRDPALMQLGTAGRKLVAKRFAWSRVAQDLAAVYDWLAGRGPQPDSVE